MNTQNRNASAQCAHVMVHQWGVVFSRRCSVIFSFYLSDYRCLESDFKLGWAVYNRLALQDRAVQLFNGSHWCRVTTGLWYVLGECIDCGKYKLVKFQLRWIKPFSNTFNCCHSTSNEHWCVHCLQIIFPFCNYSHLVHQISHLTILPVARVW